jgi:hypothetical protein
MYIYIYYVSTYIYICNIDMYVYNCQGFSWVRIGRSSSVYDPATTEAGNYVNKGLRLEKSIYGLKSARKTFMKHLGEEVLIFVERVEYKVSQSPSLLDQSWKGSGG